MQCSVVEVTQGVSYTTREMGKWARLLDIAHASFFIASLCLLGTRGREDQAFVALAVTWGVLVAVRLGTGVVSGDDDWGLLVLYSVGDGIFYMFFAAITIGATSPDRFQDRLCIILIAISTPLVFIYLLIRIWGEGVRRKAIQKYADMDKKNQAMMNSHWEARGVMTNPTNKFDVEGMTGHG